MRLQTQQPRDFDVLCATKRWTSVISVQSNKWNGTWHVEVQSQSNDSRGDRQSYPLALG